jgi:iron complex transport system substrate-binding protein
MAASPLRIISLLPSATEIVCALGAEARLVGVSHECDFPETIRDRPVLTRARIDSAGTSRAIDAAVRAVVADALSVYAVDDDLLARLAPDVVITQDLCEVCAVSLDDVRAAVARLAHRDAIRVVSLRPTRFDDVLDDLERVASAIDAVEQGPALRAKLARRVQAIARRAAVAGSRPRVVSLEWMEPLMIGGMWMPELIELAGGQPAGAAAGAPAPTITSRALAALAPEVIVIKPARRARCDRARRPRRAGRPRARLRHRWQRILQPPGATPRRVARDHGRVHPPRALRGLRRHACGGDRQARMIGHA